MQQLTDEEIYSLTQHPGQHPERLRLILEINPNQYPYSFWQVQDAASNHPNVPQDLILSGKIHPHISFCDHASLEAQVEHSQGYSMSALTESLLTHRDADNALCQKALLRTVCSGFYSHNAFPISLSFLGRLHSDSPGNLRFYESFLWWDERIVAALHPGIHPEVRTYIAKDSHRWVRAAAKAAQSNPDTWKRFWE